MVKMSAVTETPQGDIQSDTTVSDYRKEVDVLVPHKMSIKLGPMEIAMTVDSMQINPGIPKNTFDVPDEVKALIKKPQSAGLTDCLLVELLQPQIQQPEIDRRQRAN